MYQLKKSIFLAILILLFIKIDRIEAKWLLEEDISGDIFSHLFSIDCYDGNCITVGKVQGVILSKYSTNNGKQWSYGFLDSSRPNSNNNINKVVMPSKDLAFAIADKGYYYRSIDLGKNWEYGHLDVFVNLIDVDFFNDKIGVISAGRQVVITKDGGETFDIQTKIDSPVPDDFIYYHNVDVLDENTYFVAGISIKNNSRINFTYDGGKTWQQTKDFGYRLNDLHFFDKMNGIAVGYSKDLSESTLSKMNSVFKTSDGGNSWELLLDTMDQNSISFRQLLVEEDGTLMVMGGLKHLWRSSDMGSTWNQIKVDYKSGKDISAFAKLKDSVYIFCTNGGASIYRYELDGYTDVEEMPSPDFEFEPFTLFPNPARDELTIKSEQPLLEYELTDVFGTTLNSEKELLMYGMQPELKINTSKLSAGIYFLKIKTLDGIEYRKFIKE